MLHFLCTGLQKKICLQNELAFSKNLSVAWQIHSFIANFIFLIDKKKNPSKRIEFENKECLSSLRSPFKCNEKKKSSRNLDN